MKLRNLREHHSRPQVIVCDDEKVVHLLLRRELAPEWKVVSAFSAKELCLHLSRAPESLVLLDLCLASQDHGFEVLSHARRQHPAAKMIVYSGLGDYESIVRAMQLGAVDYLPKAAGIDRLRQKLQTWAQRFSAHQATLAPTASFAEDSQAATTCMDSVRRFAGSSGHVLVMGEIGSGKQLIARALHRHQGPYVVADAAALAGSDGEERLFGTRAGPPGLWQQAAGGTLCVNEVTELPIALQIKMSRLLDRQSSAESSRKSTDCVRVIATTRHDLAKGPQSNNLRQEFLAQLSVFTLKVPPLRERVADIGPLAAHFVRHFGGDSKLPLSPPFLAFLQAQTWPGNVRQLFNTLQYGLAFAGDDELRAGHIQTLFDTPKTSTPTVASADDGPSPTAASLAKQGVGGPSCAEAGKTYRSRLQALETELLQSELQRANFNIAKMAKDIGMSRTYLYEKLRNVGLLGRSRRPS